MDNLLISFYYYRDILKCNYLLSENIIKVKLTLINKWGHKWLNYRDIFKNIFLKW